MKKYVQDLAFDGPLMPLASRQRVAGYGTWRQKNAALLDAKQAGRHAVRWP